MTLSGARSGIAILLVAAYCVAAIDAPASPAGEKKPAASVATTLIEASASVDASLQAYPGLYSNLLTEARRELAKQRAQAVKDRKEDPDLFTEGRHYTFERNYALRSAIGRYVSVLRSDYMDGLGAHPNHQYETIVWDSAAKRRISIRPFFKETEIGGPALQSLADAIRSALIVEKKKREITDVENDAGLDAVKPDLLKIGAVALAPSGDTGKSAGLIVYFSPYAVGSYAEGDYTVFVAWTAFKDHLSPAGIALFGGERPADDAKNDE